MRRFIVAVALLGGLLLPASVAATDPGNWSTCSGKSYITLAEDASGGGDRIILCRPATNPVGTIVNLKNVSHVQTGLCNALFKAADNWEDCVSSWAGRFSTPDSSELTREYCAEIYRDPNAVGLIAIVGRRSYQYGTAFANFTGSDNDAASSIRWGYTRNGSGCYFS